MTPRRLDPATIQRRLVEMRRTISHLSELVPVSATHLDAHWRDRAVVERLFERLVELAVAINSHIAAALTGVPPDEYRASFRAAADAGALAPDLADRLAPAAGLRNVITHDYLETDLTLLAAGVNAAPADFDAYVRAVAAWLTEVDEAVHQP
jgi:uncharacterized protein YutE (UPF0331/DUF86 family)